MKAKHIKKLRKRIESFQSYKVRESWGLFGFDSFHENNYSEIKAGSPLEATVRFFKLYRRQYKRISRFESFLIETNSQWGRLEVVDSKGFKTYYK